MVLIKKQMLCRVFCLHCQNYSESRSGKTRTKGCERSLPAHEGRNQESLHTSAHLVNFPENVSAKFDNRLVISTVSQIIPSHVLAACSVHLLST